MLTNTGTKHTPGPWDDASKYPGIDSVRIFAGTYYIATVGNSDGPRDVTEANARLIAAAPELLAALEAMVACCTDAEGAVSPEPQDRGEWLDNMLAARAAISKAEGW